MAAPDGGPRGRSGPAPQAARRAGRSLLRPGRCGRDAPYGTAPPPRFLRQTEAGGGRPPKVTCVSSEVGTCTRPRSLSAPRAGPVCPHPCGVLPLESPLGLSGSVSLSVSPLGRAQRPRPSVARRGRPGRWQEGPMAQKAPPHLPPPPLRLFLRLWVGQKPAGPAATPTQCACALEPWGPGWGSPGLPDPQPGGGGACHR